MMSKIKVEGISEYNLLKLFFYVLQVKEKKNEIVNNIDPIFYELKQKEEFKDLLKSIKFKSNGIEYYSEQISTGIEMLQNAKVIKKTNPTFSKILIVYNNNIVNDIEKYTKKEILNSVSTLVTKFLEKSQMGEYIGRNN
ncbi:MAG: hypothetical protein ACRCSK_02275 [Fusobacteriaceae bacterium]